MLIGEKEIPERKISYENTMRPQERFLRCSFRFAKRLHYSDSCPVAVTVEERKRLVRCELCLSMKPTNAPRRKKRVCCSCSSEEHNKALCILPERIHGYRREMVEIERELEIVGDYFERGPSTSA